MKLTKTIIGIILLIISFPAASANVGTGLTQIIRIENWVGGEALFIRTQETSLTNPASCPITDKYILDENTSKVSRSILLTAYTAKLPVALTIYGGACSLDRPIIVAVTLAE